MRKHIYYSSIITLIMSMFAIQGYSQLVHGSDHLFPSKGKSMLTMATGIPYIGIAEYAYGFSDRFSMGLMYGKTPELDGYGFRVRYMMHQSAESFRMYFRMPFFYYPHTHEMGDEPWILAWPVIIAEWKLHSGTRLSLGGGVVVASCFDSFLRTLRLRSESRDEEDGGGLMGGLWNTVHGGIAVPLNEHLTFQGEISSVMSGLKLAGKDWIGGPPVIAVAGLSYNLY